MPKKTKVRRLLELNLDDEQDNKVEHIEQVREVQASSGGNIKPSRIKETASRTERTVPNFRKKKDIHVDINKNNIRLVL